MTTSNRFIRGLSLSILVLGTSSNCAAGDGRFPRLERWRERRAEAEQGTAPSAPTTGATRGAEPAPLAGGS